jgi:cytochrome c
MKKLIRTTLICLLAFPLCYMIGCGGDDDPQRILVFSRTEGYRHSSIPAGVAALRKLCKENSILMDTTEEATAFTEANLKRYAAVVFLCTTGDVLDPAEENAFQRFIQAGGGFMGIHSATDTEYKWSWFGGLVGAYFESHPEIQDADVVVKDPTHLSTQCLKQERWKRRDEWYNYKDRNPKVNILLNLDENTYKGGNMGADHPTAWYHEYDGGRSFYTGGGHTTESYSEPLFLQHLLGGLKYVLGDKKRLCYENCRTPLKPDPTRFVKTVLANDFMEPMEFDPLPDGKILIIERRGNIKLFDPATGLVSIASHLPVHSDHEDGLIGVALDPDFPKNHWIYLYYSPENKVVNRVSRFVFQGDTLDHASEKMLFEVAVQRKECCHAGGCLEFDRKGYLYLSTGDNTNPFASDGYSPSDERKGRKPWDAQGSSANTKDLRGKILRVKPLPEGGYTCPSDNLFAADTTKGRPEIYVMGCRNPFRIALDERRDLLFWGEVGPDAGEPDTSRGPAGHDEINCASRAGFFGWPYFVGNNKPYRAYDFNKKTIGKRHDPMRPFNFSPNNTGARELPPAQPALIWYPYGNSPEFPLLKNGGRNAMAGPTYYCDKYPEANRFPQYYDGKVIVYDWARNWMMAVTLDSLNRFSAIEPFADSVSLSRPMDMFIDKNGSLWVLEYGERWFARNTDARLSRIDFVRGNRPPQPSLMPDKTAGAAPCAVRFDVSKTRDYDGDRLTYTVDFGDGSPAKTLTGKWQTVAATGKATAAMKVKRPSGLDSIGHVYQTPGVYNAVLQVTDEKGLSAKYKQTIIVGNEPPVVQWDLAGKNRSFYQPGTNLNYKIQVSDLEDGTLGQGVAPSTVAATIDYLEMGFDITTIAQGHQIALKVADLAKGKLLMERSDCKTCHAIDYQVNGPSFQAIATRYESDKGAVPRLAQKIIKGGSGVWGQTVMSAHPGISTDDAQEMVRWVLSLRAPAQPKTALPAVGTYALQVPKQAEKGKKPAPGTYILQATYRDRGSSTQRALERTEVLALRPAFMQVEQADSLSNEVRSYRPTGGDTVVLRDLRHCTFFMIRYADLTSIHAIQLGLGSADKYIQAEGGVIELRLDRPDGPLAGSVRVENAPGKDNKMTFSEATLPVSYAPSGFHDLYFVAKNPQNPSQAVAVVDWIRFDLK